MSQKEKPGSIPIDRAQIPHECQPDNIGAFELHPPGGSAYFPVEVPRKPNGQLRIHNLSFTRTSHPIGMHCNAVDQWDRYRSYWRKGNRLARL
jgi:hypothetical protein